ncbi:MAG: hypothetical protein ACLQDM_02080 [Bradyrhizobium sp.]
MADTSGNAAAIPPDDPNNKLTLANPDDPAMHHISVAGGTYTILVTGAQTNGRYCLTDMLVRRAVARRLTVTTSRRCSRSWKARSS